MADLPRRLVLGRWRPDLPQLEVNGLRVAKNAIPKSIGYGPIGSLVEVGSFGALGAYARGALDLVARDGLPHNFAGDATKLYHIESGAWVDRSLSGGYTLGSTSRWESVVFTSNATNRRPQVIFATLDEMLQFFEVGASTDFADLAAAAPKAKHIAVIKEHVVVGHTDDPTDGIVPNRIWYPAQGNAASWPTPGSAAAVSALSGFNTLSGNYGPINGISGGADWGTIFQDSCVRRADWVGGSVVFDVSRPIGERGLAVPGLFAPIGARVLFFSQDGWYIFDGSEALSVGEGVIDEWFKRDFQWDFRHRVSTVVDPDRKLVHFLYCGQGSSGTPNRLLHYYWPGNAFAYSECDADYISLAVNPGPNLSMDRSPSPIPDLLTGSWDEIQTATRVFGGFTTAHKLATFSGPNPAARFETGDIELTPTRRSLTHHVRPIVKNGTPSVSAAEIVNSGTDPSYGTPAARDETGKCNVRVDARYHAFALDLATGWTGDALALDVESTPTGSR